MNNEISDTGNLSVRSAALWGIVSLFFFITFLVYFKSLWNPFVRWDDGLLIFENPAIRAITPNTLKAIFTKFDPELYIPFTFFSYQLNFLIGETNPSIYHLTNLILHTSNALLVSWFFVQMGIKNRLAILFGLIFALHPLHTEAVVWASARKDVLSVFFCLMSLNWYLVFRKKNINIWFWLSLIAFVFALLSKVVVAVLPGILFMLEWQRLGLSKKSAKRLIPYFVFAIIFILVALLGKQGALTQATFSQFILIAGKSTIFYIQKLFLPTNLSVLYPYTDPITFASLSLLITLGLAAMLGALTDYLSYKKKISGFALSIFFLALLPTYITFMKGGDIYFASDRYAYLPSIGIFLLVALLLQSFEINIIRKRIVTILLLVIISCFGIMSHIQANVWSSTESLFTHSIKLYPNSHIAHNNMGNIYRRKKELIPAIESFNTALAIKDHHRTRSNLGAVYRILKRYDLAQKEYDHVLAINPDSKEAHFGLGILQATQSKYTEAIASYTRALELDPTYAEVHINFGSLLNKLDKPEEAIIHLEKAIHILPFSSEAYYNLAVVQRKIRGSKAAMESYEISVALKPSFLAARINLAILYHERGMLDEAINQFEAVLYYNPSNAIAKSALRQLRPIE
ncbi:tetratricopeptide repeat protein [Candidatus Peregrinibacteria bacterium]|jgi:protein O-mannosyl-transferase|nr:tetratricopeptide repeat protein [Candidatus Peregrinibacteria bacterium]MBT3598468.1 tetratricopeptide repeat protein [Candidatus Peregrinibacteria bacterium]MBT4367129.1 tetratricopeptide repeat protein [Candidatus Peregrinibacteria bacterium]MBT4585998.1 tetratricopeptide repeat protein [Candidatus Peregrinibacteria bacterium]MBT6730863.1 tetratricopeptide repeat protein [Candidatus Peregrinibacteria bacterium]